MAWTEKYVSDSGTEAWATSSSGNPSSFSEMISNYAAGERVNIKAGTYTQSADTTWSTAGTVTAPVWFRGYKTTIGDMDDHPTSQRVDATDIPLFTKGGADWRYLVNAANLMFSNISFTSAEAGAGGSTVLSRGGETRWHRCKFENTGTSSTSNVFDIGTASRHWMTECLFYRPNASGPCVYVSASNSHMDSCYLKGGTIGIDISGTRVLAITNTIIHDTSSQGIRLDTGYLRLHNSIIYDTGSHAIEGTGLIGQLIAQRNVFAKVVGYAINNSSGTDSFRPTITNNAYYDVSSGQLNGVTESIQFDAIALTADPFVDAVNDDFNLNGTAGGGQTLRDHTFALPVS